ERTTTDYSILPDGKRIYIDAFRDRPGLDMSYKPNDFETRFVLPITKESSEYGQESIASDFEPILIHSEMTEENIVPVQSDIIEHESIPQPEVIESVEVQPEIIEQVEEQAETIEKEIEIQPEIIQQVEDQSEIIQQETEIQPEIKSEVQLESHPVIIEESVHIQSDIHELKTPVHLEPRPPTIVPVDAPIEKVPIIISPKKSEPIAVTKKPTIDLHGAAVVLPEVQLVKPGPLPTLSITKGKKSTGGLCASCFGSKSAEKKKKQRHSKTVSAPIEQKK
ncbi:unnamed protein product, partial [Adineta steineri]